MELRLSIIGFGSVGQGVAEVLMRKERALREMGYDFKVVAVADSSSSIVDENGVSLKDVLKRKRETGRVGDGGRSSLEIIRDVEHDVVIEVTPTNVETGEPGLSHIITAFENKRHVVTSNKGPLVLRFRELVSMAEEKGLHFRYEACVGGAMPVISLVKDVLAGNEINGIVGVLNGTCNYILTRMASEQLPYEHVLSEAKEIGIAETDPSYDVDGIDTAVKLAILVNTIFNLDVSLEDIPRRGITEITPEALALAQERGYTIKLVGYALKNGEKVEMGVSPMLVPLGHPLAVGGTLNAAAIYTDLASEITVTGRGAGSVETASAILSDLICIAKALEE
ncbi:MAG: homoserine dehydrogenase [Archaeoglobi archaeon]|nr:homoserine dehydrogenase [Candidatus Mnemosynella bozhongmuii]MDK2781241.1 homoserine dehydrogenase [Archaeoglobi archaeon]